MKIKVVLLSDELSTLQLHSVVFAFRKPKHANCLKLSANKWICKAQ